MRETQLRLMLRHERQHQAVAAEVDRRRCCHSYWASRLYTMASTSPSVVCNRQSYSPVRPQEDI